MRLSPKWGWFLAFTAFFAVLAGYVFWGCWATNVTFIAPDDGVSCLTSYGDILTRWWNEFLKTGRMLPTDVFWSGLVGSPLFCREIKYVVAVYFAALGMAYFLRGRGLSYLASYGAGLLLAFCGYWFTLFSAGHGGWFVWMTYGVFAFGLVDRALVRGSVRHWLLLGLVVAWGSFHQPDIWLLFTVFTGAYFVFRAVLVRPAWKRLAVGVALAASAFALVGAPSVYHAFTGALAGRNAQIEESKGSTLTAGATDDADARWIFVTNWSLPPAESAEFFCSRLNGDTSCPLTLSVNRAKGMRPYTGALGRPYKAKEGNYRQHSLYVGWVTCLLALAGVAAIFLRVPCDRLSVIFFAVAAVVFWLFSIGRYFEPAYRLIFMLPFGDSIRAPVKWHHLTEFCICVLAGFGIAALWHWIDAFAAWAGNKNVAKSFRCALVALVAYGAIDLTVEAHRFCAPVDYGKAIQRHCSSQLTVLPRQQFNNPQVAEMVRRGQIVSVASWLGDPNAYLVQILQPLKSPKSADPNPLPLTLGVISVLSALAIVAVCVSGVSRVRVVEAKE